MILKVIFVLALLIAFVPPVRRFLFYLLVGRQLVKEQKKQTAYQRRQQARPGETRVNSVPPNATESKINGGDYIDYEEVK